MAKFRTGFTVLMEHLVEKPKQRSNESNSQSETDKPWLDLQFTRDEQIMKLDEIENRMDDPPGPINTDIVNRIQGALIGLAIGDALGTHVEFQSREYLREHPVKDLGKGGEWNLKKGQFTDNTSMALCLANSLIARRGFVPYDQLVRYKWWYQHGYMSSIGRCFKLGATTQEALDEFIRRQLEFGKRQNISIIRLDHLLDRQLIEQFPVDCSKSKTAGSGALVRIAPIPLFFHQNLEEAIHLSGYSGQITHDDIKTFDACRYFGALLFAILKGYTKATLLDKHFYKRHQKWFGIDPLCDEIKAVAKGSYQKKGGYDDGIRAQGYIVKALEAALWAFWSDGDSFERGVLAVVNLGDDTDTTAAIYGQLAGAYYGYRNLPRKWTDQVYAKKYMLKLSKWLAYEGQNWKETEVILSSCQALAGEGCASSVSARWRQTYKIIVSPITPRRTNIGFSDFHFPSMSDPAVSLINDANTDRYSPTNIGDHLKTGSNQSLNRTSVLEAISPLDMCGNSIEILPSTIPEAIDQAESGPLSPKEPDVTRCADWSCEDVCNWIRSLGKAYETYIDTFQRQNINGDLLLNCITEEILIEFGVNLLYHRQAILYNIKQLKSKFTPFSTPIANQSNHFDSQLVGDFVPPLDLRESTYPDAMSCILKPSEDKTHAMIYEQMIQWLGPLPSSVAIDKIELVHNPESYRIFLHQLNRTERKQSQPAFQPHLDSESNPIERRKVLDRLQTLIGQVQHNRDVSVVRVWHGCKREIAPELISNGFAALGQLDHGWFGKAIYFTSSAEYAMKYTNSSGCLIMCYVIVLNPFPVISDDAPLIIPSRDFRFYGRGNYLNYQCHYIPVAPAFEGTLKNFRPPANGVEHASFDEFAIFQQSDILTHAVVYLKPGTDTSSPPSPPPQPISDGCPLKPFLSKD